MIQGGGRPSLVVEIERLNTATRFYFIEDIKLRVQRHEDEHRPAVER